MPKSRPTVAQMVRLRQEAMAADGSYGLPSAPIDRAVRSTARQKKEILEAVAARRDRDLAETRERLRQVQSGAGSKKQAKVLHEEYQAKVDHWMRHMHMQRQHLSITVAEQRAIRGMDAVGRLAGSKPAKEDVGAERARLRREYADDIWLRHRRRPPPRTPPPPPGCSPVPQLQWFEEAREAEHGRDTAAAIAAFAAGSEVRPAPRPHRARAASPDAVAPNVASLEEVGYRGRVEQLNKRSVEQLASQQYLRAYRLLMEAKMLTADEHEAEYDTPGERLQLRATTWSNLSCLHKRLGHIDKAIASLEEAFAIEEVLGRQSPATLINLAAVLLSHQSKRRRCDALIPASGAVAALEKELLGPSGDAPEPTDKEHQGVWHLYVVALHSLAMAKSAADTATGTDAARKDLADAYRVGRAALGAGHPTVTMLYRHLLQDRIARDLPPITLDRTPQRSASAPVPE